ncbi:MAG: 50S ribosomal protein L2 [Thermoplasmatota archaeon]
MGKRIIVRRRGRGGIYASPGHKHKGDIRHIPLASCTGVVEEILHAPGRSTPLARVSYEDKGGRREALVLAPDSLQVGQQVRVGSDAPLEVGNTLPIGVVPVGTQVHNVEARPGDGGKFARAGGVAATVVSQGSLTTVQLPSGRFKTLNPLCRATIGFLSGGGRREKPFVKAGKKYHALRPTAQIFPRVKGISMNPIDHPHGGGGHPHVGRPSTVGRGAWPGQKVGRLSPQRRRKR